jgi:hypothetical protein
MSVEDYSRYHGAGHRAERPERRTEPDALTRKARERRETDELFARWRRDIMEMRTSPLCTCKHPQIKHDDGTGQCMDRYKVAADDEYVDCWCTEFTAQ